MSSFDTARDLRMPGVVIGEVYIDPTQLTTRMKNSVKRMLRDGYADGGWSSEAKQLAQTIAREFDLPLLSAHGHAIRIPERRTYDDTVVKEVRQLLDIDRALVLMRIRQEYEDNRQYLDRAISNCKDRYSSMHKVVKGEVAGRWLHVSTDEIRKQVTAIFARLRSQESTGVTERVCTMIDNGDRIYFKLEY